MEFKDRLKQSRKYAKLTQPELANEVKLLGGKLSQQMISMVESGARYDTAAIFEIAKACGVRAEWLKNGSGDMIDYKIYDQSGEYGNCQASCPSDEQIESERLLHLLLKSSDDKKQAIHCILKPEHNKKPAIDNIVKLINTLP